MAVIVADASVVVKWLMPEREERDVEPALALLDQVRSRRVKLRQPPHWLAEAAAVVTRLNPETAERKVAALCAMQCAILDTQAVYLVACKLALQLNHHLFDTLYHAVALDSPDCTLVTADERYYRKARGWGQIVRLAEYDA